VVQHPLVERYVTRLGTELASLACPESQDIVNEIRNHIAEASAQEGRSMPFSRRSAPPTFLRARMRSSLH